MNKRKSKNRKKRKNRIRRKLNNNLKISIKNKYKKFKNSLASKPKKERNML
jgi:hypothetical protein